MKNKKTFILGVQISNEAKTEVLEKISEYLEDDKPRYIITPNPEIILEASDGDEEYFYILNKADIAIADGFGLKIAAWLRLKNVRRITGADFVLDLFKMLEEKKKRVLILNWRKGLSKSEEISKEIKRRFPKLDLRVENSDKVGAKIDLVELSKFRADFLFVNFGAPYQEKFIFHNLHKLKNLKCAMGVGGAFDFLTGKARRAPKILRVAGLEWLWRLVKQPARIKRIYKAVIVFPFKFFLWNFLKPFFYRPNVVCMAYKKINGKFKILLVERMNEAGHWQLPQGGTDGESLPEAGLRELREELNSDKFVFKKVFKNLYKYKFGNSLNSSGLNSGMVLGYKGQKQGLIIVEFVGEDKDLSVNFFDHSSWKWTNSESLLDDVHLVRKKSAKIFLEKFNEVKNSL